MQLKASPNKTLLPTMKSPQPKLWQPGRNTERGALPSTHSDKEGLRSQPYTARHHGAAAVVKVLSQIKRRLAQGLCLLHQSQEGQSLSASSALSPLSPHPSSRPSFHSASLPLPVPVFKPVSLCFLLLSINSDSLSICQYQSVHSVCRSLRLCLLLTLSLTSSLFPLS